MRAISSCLLVLLSVCCILAQFAGAKDVTVQVGTDRWRTTPLEEAVEAARALNESLYWSLIAEVDCSNAVTDKDRLEVVFDFLAQQDVPSHQLSLLKATTVARVHAPLVETLQQLRKQGDVNPEGHYCDEEDSALVSINGEEKICISSKDDVSTVLKEKLSSMDSPKSSLVSVFETNVHAFDAVYRGMSENTAHVAIVHSMVGQTITRSVHAVLSAMPEVAYVMRLKVPFAASPYLPGYGCSLDIKNMEYKAVDEKEGSTDSSEVLGFNTKVLAERYPEFTSTFQEFTEEIDENAELKVWQLQSLGYQAVHAITTSQDPFGELTTMTQRFPFRVAAVSRIPQAKIKPTVDALGPVQMRHGEANHAFVLNGRTVTPQRMDLFSLLSEIQAEEKDYAAVSQVFGFESLEAVQALLQCPYEPTTKGTRYWLDPEYIQWANDLETDEFYRDLPIKLRMILKPSFYGQPQFIRRNLIHMVFILDPRSPSTYGTVTHFLRLLRQGIAVRFGLVLATSREEDPLTDLMLEGFYKVLGEKSVMEAMTFLQNIHKSQAYDTEAVQALLLEMGLGQFDAGSDEMIAERRIRTNAYIKKLGFRTFPLAFFNGLMFSEGLENALYQGFNGDFPLVKSWISSGTLTDDMKDLYSSLMEAAGALKRHQPLVADADQLKYAPLVSASQLTALSSIPWFFPNGYEDDPIHHSHLLMLKESTKQSIRHAIELFSYLQSCGEKCMTTQAAVLLCSGDESLRTVLATLIRRSQDMALRKRVPHVLGFLRQLLESAEAMGDDWANLAPILNNAVFSAGDTYKYLLEGDREAAAKNLQDMTGQCQSLQQSTKSINDKDLLYSSGRAIVLDETFQAEDYALLENFEQGRSASVVNCLQAVDFSALQPTLSADEINNDFYAVRHFALSSVLGNAMGKRGVRDGAEQIPPFNPTYSIAAEPAGARHSLHVMLNPISRESQKMVGLIQALRQLLDIKVSIVLNPPTQVSQVPIKNFYSYVAPSLTFAADGSLSAPKASFRGMPTKQILTMGVDTPEAWVVFATEAAADLDNIRLSTLQGSMLHAEYTLHSITVTGSCEDTQTGAPPRGLPVRMISETVADAPAKDTLVMSNYGYFQLPGGPGLWKLELIGKGDELYTISEIKSTEAEKVYTNKPIPVTSFLGEHVSLTVSKRPGKEGESLLFEGSQGEMYDEEDTSGTPTWPPQPQDTPPAEPPVIPTLNIFSVASGHLYERFLRMMMHTVVKSSKDKHGENTTHIKFWFIENFLSPKFKAFLPRLSKELGCSYQLVTYKWPHWLRAQTEKQRIIWAYKILFLDVLFPLDVEKVIFVDADQIVRADLHELYNMDLHGRAVAYTPFCHGEKRRDETKGFRFWDSGYWVDHLRGRFYHISAIYVVDLKRLRQYAAGDQYRMIYDSLSSDPNSLANLDQDLPNFAQHQVPIYSLPQEWLWCETWCTDGSKEDAKTIDLCNNPLTKTPKLENAKRIIPDWEEMDAELQRLEDDESNSMS